ncbi:MAG: DUF2335 domain-containing protein [Ignavibacteriaceae bacterium]|nr:DUF2335 domain-containing protein [Ignavibacteriaceae bacterium]
MTSKRKRTRRIKPEEDFPSPGMLKDYEKVIPGLAQNIINYTERQTVHRIEMERKLITSNIRKSYLGLIFGFLIGVTGIGGGMYLTTIGFNIIGIMFSSGTLVSLVMSFIYGSQSKKCKGMISPLNTDKNVKGD